MTNYEGKNLALFVAAYGDDEAAANEDFQELIKVDPAAVVASVVARRDADGKVKVREHGGREISAGTEAGVATGLVIGLFAPPLLAATVVGAGIGAAAGAIARRHEEHKIGSSMAENDWLPPGSSALLAVIYDEYLERVDTMVVKATKKVHKPIDNADYDAVVQALEEGGEQIVDTVDAAGQ
jgi:uncharacterized membrane protein